MENQNQSNFEEVVETLANMFGDVLSKEVIFTVVESFGGDLNLSAEAIVNITGDGNTMKPPNTATNTDNLPKYEKLNQEVSSSAKPDLSSNMNMTMLYSGKTGSLGAVPKQPLRPYRPTPGNEAFWTDQLRRILTYHMQGSRILILLRGIPGSGKTYLGRQIVDVTVGATFDHHKCHILSTDDFFIVRGSYQYDRSRLTEAHDWNKERVSHALRDGLSPVIVDNTNVSTWEMEPYVRAGVENGYFIEVVEPNTPWAKKARQLFNRNSHNVPFMTIKRMLGAYVDNITADNLITEYGLQYPCNYTPPILRTYPPVADVIHRSPASDYNITQIQDNKRTISEQQNVTERLILKSNNLPQDAGGEFTNAGSESNDQQLFTDTKISKASTNKPHEEVLNVRYIEAHKKLEEMEKVEDKWEKEESWEEILAQNTATVTIDALWMESVMFQLDKEDKQTERMIKEDEEFARQLEMKHAELSLARKEAELPNFKEIMDMDFALSVHLSLTNDVAEWRNNEPNDLAAKMTRDKLYNLFEDISRDVLSELLLAHDYNFEATVEVLLTSTGNGHILKEKNGLNKFIMNKEIIRMRRILEENSRVSLDEEWPLLPMGQNITMSVVDKYRNEADMHLARRNHNYAKAQDYIRRGMLDVADYYSVIAAFHKKQYEQANSKAVVSLVQVHARNSPSNATIDLHYLRVAEAKEFLDLFLDNRIQNLKQNRTMGRRYQELFIITGRGLHSPTGPRIKPAVKSRILQRGLRYTERNPGLLSVRVYANSPLSHELAG